MEIIEIFEKPPAPQEKEKKEDCCPACGSTIERTREWEGQGWRVIAGDAVRVLDGLPSGTVDAIITDPPYGSGGDSWKARQESSKRKYTSSNAKYAKERPEIMGDSMPPAAWERLMRDVFFAAKARAAENAVFAVFIDWRQLGTMCEILASLGYRVRGVAVWDKGRGVRPYRGGFRMQAEFVVWGSIWKKLARDDFFSDGVIREGIVRGPDRLHITQKPVALMSALVELAPPGGLVLDPFAGASSTGVAAVLSGRQYIGIEAVEEYAEAGARRLTTVKVAQNADT